MKKNGWAMSCGAQMIDIHRGRVVGDDWITLELNEYHEQKNMPGMTKLLRSVCGEHGEGTCTLDLNVCNQTLQDTSSQGER
jgi:hypothetical protein